MHDGKNSFNGLDMLIMKSKILILFVFSIIACSTDDFLRSDFDSLCLNIGMNNRKDLDGLALLQSDLKVIHNTCKSSSVELVIMTYPPISRRDDVKNNRYFGSECVNQTLIDFSRKNNLKLFDVHKIVKKEYQLLNLNLETLDRDSYDGIHPSKVMHFIIFEALYHSLHVTNYLIFR